MTARLLVRRRLCCAAAMLVSLAACAPGAETPAPVAPATAALFTPRAVHEALIIPGSNLLFSAESEPPADDAAWAAVLEGAGMVIVGAQALQTEPLSQERADWFGFAQTVIDNTRLTAEALKQKNADDLVFTNGDMMSGCTGCHQAYRQAPQ